MFKFFRKIRQTLLSENKLRKYLIYAIGEIVLVVIGILIALQINNWNEDRKLREKESLLLAEIHKEFKQNREQLNQVVKHHQLAFNSCEKLIGLFPIDTLEVNLDTLSSHISNTQWKWTFDPSNGSIDALINSSEIGTISDAKLRSLAISWNDILKDYQDEEKTAFNIVINYLEPYLFENFEFSANLRDSRTPLKPLTTVKFENVIKRRHDNLNDILISGAGELHNLRQVIDEIITLTKPK